MPPLPTKVIDIGEGTRCLKPHLVEASTDVVSAPYMTLSYCWGGNDSLKLTAPTIEELRSGVSISQLPKTIQDAIQVALHLEIRYIWVDALCILQDSPTDWAKEAASMSDVYRNSFLAIAASGASNSEQGLFAQRDPLICTPCWMFNAGRDDGFMCIRIHRNLLPVYNFRDGAAAFESSGHARAATISENTKFRGNGGIGVLPDAVK